MLPFSLVSYVIVETNRFTASNSSPIGLHVAGLSVRRLQSHQDCRTEPRIIFPLWPVFARLYSGLALIKHVSSHDMNEGSEDEFGSPGLLSTDSCNFQAALRAPSSIYVPLGVRLKI